VFLIVVGKTDKAGRLGWSGRPFAVFVGRSFPRLGRLCLGHCVSAGHLAAGVAFVASLLVATRLACPVGGGASTYRQPQAA
jgi:hypothetical protein